MTFSAKRDLLLVLYIIFLTLANLLGSKITGFPISWDIGEWQGEVNIRFSVGLLLFPWLFLITDIIAETLGRQEAQKFVKLAFLVQVVTFVCIFIFINLPPVGRSQAPVSPGVEYSFNQAYAKILGSSLRIIVGSLTAFAIAQTLDVHLFHYLKKKFQNRWLWLRNNLSTTVSQFIDTAIFYTIAFAPLPFALPVIGLEAGDGLAWMTIWSIFWPYYLQKVLLAMFDTPLVYLGKKWLQRSEK
jgi:hypothetical protein